MPDLLFPKTLANASPTNAEPSALLVTAPVPRSTRPEDNTVNAVSVHTTIVSANTSKIPHIPWRTGSLRLNLNEP